MTQHNDCHFSAIPFQHWGVGLWGRVCSPGIDTEQKWYLNFQIAVFTPTDPARLVRTESVPCDINNPLRKPPRYSDLHISQTLPKTNKINKVRLGFRWVQACWVRALPYEEQEGGMFSNRTRWIDLGALPLLPSTPGLSCHSVWFVSRKVWGASSHQCRVSVPAICLILERAPGNENE